MAEEKAVPAGDTVIPDLLHQIVFQMLNDSHSSHRALEDSLRYSLDRTTATLELVRESIDSLLAGPYMPSMYAISSALWPSDKAIEQRVQDNNSRYS